MKQIVILVLVSCCILGCSNQRTVGTLSQPTAADVTHISAQQFTSILMVAPSHPQTKNFMGYEDGLAYLTVTEEKNGITEQEFYCTPKAGLPKHVLDTLESMKKK